MAYDCGKGGTDSGPVGGPEGEPDGGPDGGKGKGKAVDVEEEMNWNDRTCFIENLKAELIGRQKELKEIYGDCSSEEEQDKGQYDGLQIISEGEEEQVESHTGVEDSVSEGEKEQGESSEDSKTEGDEEQGESGSGGEDSESEDEDYCFNAAELSMDEGGDECEDDDDGGIFDNLVPNESTGHLEEARVQQEPDGSEQRPFFMLGGTYTDKAELVRAINNYAIKSGVKVRLTKSEPYRVRARCQKGCPFVLGARLRNNSRITLKHLPLPAKTQQ